MEKESFKKPVLIGKVGKFPKKVINEVKKETLKNEITEKEVIQKEDNPIIENTSLKSQQQTAELSYKEPDWGGIPDCDDEYVLEVLKSGQIVERINLMKKSFTVIGRLDDCDITMAHPTVSRYHAILQYRKIESEDNPKGFYLFDLSSTHGTFLNKQKLKPRVYGKVYVGHMIKFGCSTRTYLLNGPEYDTENEDPLTVTELKQKRKEDIEKRRLKEEEDKRMLLEEEEEKRRKLEERGVDWGMGDDADEETDLSENPYAQTNNEELYLDDPKKALRGFFEREGLDLEYDCNEQGPGQFLCKVQLPIDDERGKSIFAEVLHKGKKKEAVIQCALEACRILDRHGILRQATHESRKRKAKNWEENDFYDSDDDTFLDRTGVIEKKREIRMKNKVPQQAETYQSLAEKELKLNGDIKRIETQLLEAENEEKNRKDHEEGDSLETFMKKLKRSKGIDKEKKNKLKIELQQIKNEMERVKKLMGIAKPTNLPELVVKESKKKDKLPIFGKRLKVKVNLPQRNEEKFDFHEENEIESENKIEETTNKELEKEIVKEPENNPKTEKDQKKSSKSNSFIKDWNKIEINFSKTYPLMPHNHERYVSLIWQNLKKLHPEYLEDMKNDVIKIFEEYLSISSSLTGNKFANDVDFIITGIKLAENGADISKLASKFLELSREITHLVNENEKDDDDDDDTSEMKEDDFEEDYDMWVPPENQTGDGRTSLNDKFGY
nr:kanadaptin [Onthophagus taurus]XP_022905251.1 kanadaptin [Onthophagus taurus]XP_022905252.1 kanadaptin [Onthophagus taurus]XP_022905253.1 kanadaptin [Onthophagus taurus]